MGNRRVYHVTGQLHRLGYGGLIEPGHDVQRAFRLAIVLALGPLLAPILATIEGGETTRDVRAARALLAELA